MKCEVTRFMPITAPRQIFGVSCIARMRADPPKCGTGTGAQRVIERTALLICPGGVLLTLPPRAKSVAGAATGTGRMDPEHVILPPPEANTLTETYR